MKNFKQLFVAGSKKGENPKKDGLFSKRYILISQLVTNIDSCKNQKLNETSEIWSFEKTKNKQTNKQIKKWRGSRKSVKAQKTA